MSLFNDKQIKAMETGEYICESCGTLMVFEDEFEDSLVCLECGYSTNVDEYGFTEEEYESLFLTKEEYEKKYSIDDDEEPYEKIFNDNKKKK
jgi:hypothetical protein